VRDPVHWLIDRLARRIAYEIRRDEEPSRRDQYQAIATLTSRYGGSTELAASELRVFSQNGEDGVLAAIFARIGTTNRYFVEFGVEDGIECNTRFLMDVLGWSGLYLEPSNTSFAELSERLAPRADVTVRHAAVTPQNVNELLASAPDGFDLLSIDVDGQDYWIWEAIENRPRVVVIEYNATLDPLSRKVEPEGRPWTHRRSTYFGASEAALKALGERKGYRLVYADLAGVNLFFVRDELASGFEEPLSRGMNLELRGRRHGDESGAYAEV
jgi:hypothetical protein